MLVCRCFEGFFRGRCRAINFFFFFLSYFSLPLLVNRQEIYRYAYFLDEVSEPWWLFHLEKKLYACTERDSRWPFLPSGKRKPELFHEKFLPELFFSFFLYPRPNSRLNVTRPTLFIEKPRPGLCHNSRKTVGKVRLIDYALAPRDTLASVT